jgi:hypothetical protein
MRFRRQARQVGQNRGRLTLLAQNAVKEFQPLRNFGVPELLKLKTSRANPDLENRNVFACHRDAAE